MNIRFMTAICGTVVLAMFRTDVGATAQTIDRETLSSRTHTTWEGTYGFSEEQVLRIEGLEELHLLIYRCAGREGMLVDFAQVTTDGRLRLLREADTDVKGVTPVFEGADVLVDSNEADIIVRWRHPGEGGLRTVEKYCYDQSGVRLINRSHFLGTRPEEMRWCGDEDADRSTSAKFRPLALERRAELAATGLAGRITQEELDVLLADMTGPDSAAAKEAVQRLADLGAPAKLIAVALEYPAPYVRVEAAKRLKPIASRDILPDVIKALEAANADPMDGGSEAKLANRRLKRELLSLIEGITKIDLANLSAEDIDAIQSDAIQNVIHAARKWMQEQEKRETKG